LGFPVKARRYAISNAAIIVVDLIVSFSYSIFSDVDLILAVRDVLATLLLLESGILFLIGGFIAYGGTIFISKVRQQYFKSGENWTPESSMKGEKNALFFVALAGILFAESLILSV